MMDSVSHSTSHFHWAELLEVIGFLLLSLVVFILIARLSVFDRITISPQNSSTFTRWNRNWINIPEAALVVFALPLHLLWEIAQFPLYTVWHEGDWGYILYGLVHCTLGDLMIILSAFWIVSLLNRSRHWIYSPSLNNIALFTILGLCYTIYSEIMNTRVKGTWGYTELMPVIPAIDIGGMPFLQWLLIPPILILLIKLISLQYQKTIGH